MFNEQYINALETLGEGQYMQSQAERELVALTEVEPPAVNGHNGYENGVISRGMMRLTRRFQGVNGHTTLRKDRHTKAWTGFTGQESDPAKVKTFRADLPSSLYLAESLDEVGHSDDDIGPRARVPLVVAYNDSKPIPMVAFVSAQQLEGIFDKIKS